MEELTLYTLQQEGALAAQNAELAVMRAELKALRTERDGWRELEERVNHLLADHDSAR